MDPALSVYGVLAGGALTSVALVWYKPFRKEPTEDGTLAEVSTSDVVPNSYLAWYRLLTFLYGLSISVYQVVRKGTRHLRFYTIWNWSLLVFYFGCVALLTFRHSSLKNRGRGQVSTKITALSKLASILFSINVASVALVDIITWVVLYPMLIKNAPTPERQDFYRTMFLSFLSYNQHGVNAVFMLGEMLLSNMPLKLYMLGYLGFWSFLYSLWAFAFHAYSGEWLYPFLDTSKPYAPLSYAALYLSHWVFFGGVYAIYLTKQWVFRRYVTRPASRRKAKALKSQ